MREKTQTGSRTGPYRSLRRAAFLSTVLVVAAVGLTFSGFGPFRSAAVGEAPASEPLMPPANGVMGFLVTDFRMPIVEGLEACPNGPVPRLRDAYVETLDPAEKQRLMQPGNEKELESGWRSYAFGPNGSNICTNPEMFDRPVMSTVKSPYSIGFDLDGADGAASDNPDGCPQQDFVSPSGERGIDNQEYRALGCTLEYRAVDGGLASEAASGQLQFLKSGEWTQVILLRGVDSLQNDNNVEVIYGNTPDRPYLDSNGKFLPDGTFTISDAPPRHRNALKGKIVNGVLTTEPKDIALTQTWGQGGARDIRGNRTIFDFRQGRLRLTFQPDGSVQGMLGGYRPLIDTFIAQALGGAGTAIVAGIDCATYMSTAKRLADGLRNPKTGQCEGISSAQKITAIPAFVNDVRPRRRTASK